MAHESLIDGSPTDSSKSWIDSLVWGGRWIDADGGKTTIGYALREGYDNYYEAWGGTVAFVRKRCAQHSDGAVGERRQPRVRGHR